MRGKVSYISRLEIAEGRRCLGNYTYNLSLRFAHPDADLAGIPGKLGLKAHRFWKKGDACTAPNGRVLGGDRKSSYCSVRLLEKQADLSAGLKSTLAYLQPHKNYLASLTADGVTLELFVAWFSDTTSGDLFDWQLLRDIAALKISLGLDFYAPDPVDEAET